MASPKKQKRSGFSGGSFLIGLLLGGGGVLLVLEVPGLFTDQLASLPEVTSLEEPEIVFEFPEILRNSEVPADPDAYRSPEARRRAEAAETEGQSGAEAEPGAQAPSGAEANLGAQAPSGAQAPPGAQARPGADAGGSPAAGQRAEAAPAPERVRLHIQAASFRDRGEAERLRARLLLEDLPAYMARVELESGAWYRVTLGPIESRAEANRIMSRLRGLNLSAVKVNKSS